MELILHPLTGKHEKQSGMEVRWFTEGIATSHFSSDSLRVTGNPHIDGAPSILIFGDSYVEAFQVNDEETMGSVLERRLRSSGRPWNVLQYGWSGADGPEYIYAAPMLKQKYPYQRIFVVMNSGDFVPSSQNVRLVRRREMVTAETISAGFVPGHPASNTGKMAGIFKESGLFYACGARFLSDILPRLTNRGSDLPSVAARRRVSADAVDIVITGLKQAYGDNLVVLYVPAEPYLPQDLPQLENSVVLDSCRAHGIACVSLYEPILQELEVNHRLARGFNNTAPAWIHLNKLGHRLAANAMYDWLKSH
ncbi:MAG TPA: hypothetical protein VKL99_07395 [Candidatus Angelobacter sp.]|nr:hypothetical protein [Candidatus Angelobacter sp.]